ncbi:ABC transporter permease [Clostridium tetani]|uniref:Ribose ABC transporter permease n=1 Tax=Clostridium tetani TaxID=1513 RepID=A0ABY0EQN0_CLOTA|nr:ribose ABC transporter permease [Clostridium tetani]RXI38521.1 ribose ABC transporter permease [Clostridium tetani]RXI54280.1 ribose ABC transporter permease [Clostridium tetani]RXI68942.1 ribose ABC transporter permease [Clostridium tetani]CDI48966.1 ribose transport system permease protein rbsC [Clostridium tetani 12124569]
MTELSRENNKVSKKDIIQKFSTVLILVMLMIALTVMKPVFMTGNNIMTILLQTAVIAVIAIGETLVIITSGIDLSVGSLVAISGVASAIFMRDGMNMILACMLGILISTACGLINGFIVAKGNIPEFIVTLGMMSIVRGASLVVTQGLPVSGLPDGFQVLGTGKLFGVIPVPAVIMIILAVIFTLILRKTLIGRYTYAIGSNEEATKLSGINTDRVKITVYGLSGLLAGIAGILLTARLISAQPTAGTGYELDAIAAAVIGGASLAGGEGTITGTIIGALIMGVLRNGLNLLNVSAFWQQIVIGAIIIAAVYGDKLKNKKLN